MTDGPQPSPAHCLEIAHVLFMDVVAYSTLPVDKQQRLLADLQEAVRNTSEFARAQAEDQLIRLPTGDGMALVFFRDPESPIRCAFELSRNLREHPEIKLRMGVHSGPVYRVADINANRSVAGGGINIAQRVMDCGDAGHILLSSAQAEVLGQVSAWSGMLHDLGEVEVKHGVHIHLYNLSTDEAGNAELPKKIRAQMEASASAVRTLKKKKLSWAMIAAALAVVTLAATGGWFYFPRRVHALKATDSVVLADFSNKTGDPVFDDTLKQALSVSLGQSPFLNILSDQKVRSTLKLMGRSPGDPLPPDVAHDVCQRTGSAAVFAGSITSLGSQYVLGLNAMNCRTGEMLAQEQVQAARKEEVLKALDKAAARLREKLGESLRTVQEYDTPLANASTPSLEALKAYSVGLKKAKVNDVEAIPFLKHAIELDRDFASAYESMAVCYYNLGESGLAIENFGKAYALRDRVSEREKLTISARYYEHVTGEIQKAIETYELWAQAYPRDAAARGNLGTLYGGSGQYEKAVTETLEAMRLDPDGGANYSNLILSYAALNRFEDAKEAYKQQEVRKIEDPQARVNWFGIAFVQGDTAEMERLLAWSAGKPSAEDAFLSAKSDMEAFSGHLSKAREFTHHAVESALRSDQKETAAQWQMDEAIWEAEFGNLALARRETSAALALTTNHDTQILAAIALARAGDPAEAEKIANDLAKRYPLDTLVQDYWLPVIRASIDIDRNDVAGAIAVLEAASPYELASPQTWSGLGGPLYPAYLRGQAYLLLRQGTEAAAEFQKPIDHQGFMLACPLRALAHLGLARAYTLQGDVAKSRATFEDFFALWKDSDADIPILKTAKAEYAKLQ